MKKVIAMGWLLLLGLACGVEEAPDPGDNGETTPIANGEWTWVEVEGSTCGNGTPGGLGIYPGDDSRLVIFFAGGGACWDTVSCYVVGSAVNIEATFTQQRLEQEVRMVENSGLLNRQDGPFGAATVAYVPYCTADLHTGDSVGSYDPLNPDRLIHHQGAVNVEAYLDYLSASYPNAQEIFVVGVSAGGYGAMMNHHRISQAFSGAPVHVLADGAPMVQPREGRWGAWKNAWEMQFPPGCQECEETFPKMAAHVVDSARGSRFALLTWEDDHTIAIYFAYPLDGLGPSVRGLIEEVYPDTPGGQAAAFRVTGTDHVALQYYDSLTDDDGVSLRDFVGAWASGEALEQ